MHRLLLWGVRVAILVILAISLSVLAGWVFGISWLKSYGPDLPEMKVASAVCFLFISLALGLISSNKSGLIIRIVPVLIGGLLIVFNLLGLLADLGLKFNSDADAVSSFPVFSLLLGEAVRISILSSSIFIIIGITLILISSDNPVYTNLAHVLFIPAAVVSYLFPVSYILGVVSIHQIFDDPISLASGLAFTSVSLAIFLMNPDSWLLKVFTSPHGGGIMTRRLLPWIFIFPLFLGYVIILGEKSERFDSDFGEVLIVVAYTFSFIILTWFAGKSVNDIVYRKEEAGRLAAVNEELERRVSERTTELLLKNERIEILSQTSGSLLGSENPMTLMNSLCTRVMNFLDCQVFFNFMVDEEKGMLHLNSCSGIPDETKRDLEWLEPGAAVCGYVAREGTRYVAENIPESHDPRTSLINSFGIRAYVCHPLLTRDKVIGTLSFGTKERARFSDDDISMMKSVAVLVSLAIDRVRHVEAVLKSEEKYRRLMELSPGASFVIKSDRIVLLNSAARNLLGAASNTEVLGKPLLDLFHTDSHGSLKTTIDAAMQGDCVPMFAGRIVKVDGSIRDIEAVASGITDSDGQAIQLIVNDVTDRINGERALLEYKNKLDIALDSGKIGIWEWTLESDSFKLDNRMEIILGILPGTFENTIEAFENCIHDEDLLHVRSSFRDALQNKVPLDTVFRIRHANDDINFISTKAQVEISSGGEPVKMTGVCFDITEMKKGAEGALFILNENLLRSNKELEQFAYVASHDLQEPLRNVSSFTQLLSKRYNDKLDEDARDFIHYAVQGAARMQVLINDLLEYSRIQTRGKSFTPVDMHNVLGLVIRNLNMTILERNAIITNDELPEVMADDGQMVQLIQNLIWNSLKFCTRTPLIHISATPGTDHFRFSVKDNGIGIEPQYFDRIFQIFKRLHPQNEYGGTGIGLAICKRIVDRHGGKIWVESEAGMGSVFHFTLLKNPNRYSYEKSVF